MGQGSFCSVSRTGLGPTKLGDNNNKFLFLFTLDSGCFLRKFLRWEKFEISTRLQFVIFQS